jgi:ribose-phosphate pyrophosphokinase
LIGGRMDRGVHGVNILRTVCDVINSLNFDSIEVIWPHSSSTIDLLDAKHNTYLEKLFIYNSILQARSVFESEELDICLPDGGAVKRWYNDHADILGQDNVSWKQGHIGVQECSKHRNPITAELSGFGCPYNVRENCLIVDDICDGGGTFSGLAVELRKAGAKLIGLAVYHGLLFKDIPEGIDFVYTTNSARNHHPWTNLHVEKVV